MRVSRPARTGACILVASMLIGGGARAGGFDELPDHGSQALGRGAAFTAKADDGSALVYNVAGFARQRGTKLHLSTNLHFNTFYFARTGNYPDSPTDPATPWGGKPFPVVADKNAMAAIPTLAASTDLGFERLTIAAGLFAPAATNRTFQMYTEGGAPAPSRYDSVQSSSLVAFPTIAAAYRITPQIDIGIGAHLVVANLDILSVAYADLGNCKTVEDSRCDAEGRLKASGMGYAGSIGVLARPTPSFQIGAQFRSPASVPAKGEVSSKLGKTDLPPNPATVTLDLPWIIRGGVRYIAMKKDFEQYDIELDGTYEAWSTAQSAGPTVVTKSVTGGDKPLVIESTHRWKDTFSVRLGGAYNTRLSETDEDGPLLTLRGGAYFDSATTDNAYTRLDANTMEKVAGTAGVGLKLGAFALNVAYAAVYSIPRIVTDGDIRPANGAKNGERVDAKGNPLPAVNNGEYRAFTHVVSLGVEVSFDVLFGNKRKPAPAHVVEPAEEEAKKPAPKVAVVEKVENVEKKTEEVALRDRWWEGEGETGNTQPTTGNTQRKKKVAARR